MGKNILIKDSLGNFYYPITSIDNIEGLQQLLINFPILDENGKIKVEDLPLSIKNSNGAKVNVLNSESELKDIKEVKKGDFALIKVKDKLKYDLYFYDEGFWQLLDYSVSWDEVKNKPDLAKKEDIPKYGSDLLISERWKADLGLTVETLQTYKADIEDVENLEEQVETLKEENKRLKEIIENNPLKNFRFRIKE